MADNNYYHWCWGENILREDDPQYLINLEHGLCIRFDYADSYFASYEEFYSSIADVQFLTGQRPDNELMQELFADAWNFLVLSEKAQDEILSNLEDDDDDW